MDRGDSEPKKIDEADFQRVLREHSERVQRPPEDILREARKGPRFRAAAEEKSRSCGMSANAILQDDLHRVFASDYPTEACVTPEDLQDFARSQALSKEIESHIRSCDNCKTLLDLANPRPEQLEIFMDEVRASLSADLPKVGKTVGRLYP